MGKLPTANEYHIITINSNSEPKRKKQQTETETIRNINQMASAGKKRTESKRP